jgi:two-component system, NtrC family, response regulator AtoC
METFRIFIVEDDSWYGEISAYHLSLNPDYEVRRFFTAKDCLQNLHKKTPLVTIDYSLPDTNGEKLFIQLRTINTSLPVIVKRN